ncbi:hypothetical protein KOR42_33690 [Thalassoglobus neptunius]|uniref:Uncharacterized protein n=1 Tax=Thalassoglobus neptunius TaxID=1938619 RepID=A0A5C5WNV0_9PLAN|nr:hypothetical protein [Thalassoglobus neptunius]TWT51895.1 hypothetical protein KOR42_33690 [Thalassoglobus neptunius]
MALFERKRFVWNEPWFFQQRIRATSSWINLALILGAAAAVVGLVFFFAAPAGQPKNWFEIIGMSIGFAAAIWWLLDGVETRRQAVLFEDSLVVGGDMGKYSHPTTYKLSEVSGFAIVLPEESKWPEPALFFHYDGEEQAIGIDSKAGLTRVAQAIHDSGKPIRLDGWEPDQDQEFKKAFQWNSESSDSSSRATFEQLPDGTPGLMNAGGMLKAIFHQCWALGLWLIFTGYLGYYGYQNWNNLGVVRFALLIMTSIGGLYVAGTYTDRIATAAASFDLMHMALEQIRKRTGVRLDLDSDDLIPVEILEPDQIAKTIQVIHEMGYFQVDSESKELLFEGKKQRWTIPAGAIKSLELEEVQTGTPGQSAMGALNYFVMITLMEEEEKVFAIRHGQRDYGEFNDVKRAAGAIEIYEAIEEILS